MRRLKLFPKIFLYTLGILLVIVLLTHGLIYLLAPKMDMEMLSGGKSDAIVTVSLQQEKLIMEAIRKALPISMSCSLLISIVCSLLLSRAISRPIQGISAATAQMKVLDKTAGCVVRSGDEIGMLADNINDLYTSLLSTIEHLENEKERVGALERSKADFLRAASHELKTPVTALNATLENMILGVGKYRDYEVWLPECKEMVEQLSAMIHDILETSRLNMTLPQEAPAPTDAARLVAGLCEPYRLIAAARGIAFVVTLPEGCTIKVPEKDFCKAVSNILSNAVSYTPEGKSVAVYMSKNALVIENECVPLDLEEIPRLFEPFYRPDYSRSRECGGNGLGLYIAATVFKTMNISYNFAPMDDPPGMRFTIYLD